MFTKLKLNFSWKNVEIVVSECVSMRIRWIVEDDKKESTGSIKNGNRSVNLSLSFVHRTQRSALRDSRLQHDIPSKQKKLHFDIFSQFYRYDFVEQGEIIG